MSIIQIGFLIAIVFGGVTTFLSIRQHSFIYYWIGKNKKHDRSCSWYKHLKSEVDTMLKILVLLYALTLLFLGIRFCVKVRRDLIEESNRHRGWSYMYCGKRCHWL